MRTLLTLLALVAARAQPRQFEGMDESQILAGTPKEWQPQVKEYLDGDTGGDITQAQVEEMKRLFTPQTPLTNLISFVDPACLPAKCEKATQTCRVARPDCEKRLECLQKEQPSVCWDMPLVEMSAEEGSLLMCAQEHECLEFGMKGYRGSLLQTGDGSLAWGPVQRKAQPQLADLKLLMSQRKRHLAADGDLDTSFAELDEKVAEFAAGVAASTDPEVFDLEQDIGNIATGDKSQDFDAVLERMESTKARMRESNQKLQSLQLKLDGDEKRLAERRNKEPAQLGVAATSFLETPDLAKLHQELGDFLRAVKKDSRANEAQVDKMDVDLKAKLADGTKQLALSDKLLSPETERALAVASSLVETADAASAAVDTDEGERLSAVDKDGNITPEAAMVISQLKDIKMSKPQQLLAMIEGFQDAAGKPGDGNVTAVLHGVHSLLQDSQAHGFGHVLESMVQDHLAPHKDEDPQAFLERMSQVGPGGLMSMAFGNTSAESVMAAMGGMAALGIGGLNATEMRGELDKSALNKYLKPLNIYHDSPLVKAGAKYMESGNEADEVEMDKMFPSSNDMMSSVLQMLEDPAATGELTSKFGLAVPAGVANMAKMALAHIKEDQEKPENMRQEKPKGQGRR